MSFLYSRFTRQAADTSKQEGYTDYDDEVSQESPSPSPTSSVSSASKTSSTRSREEKQRRKEIMAIYQNAGWNAQEKYEKVQELMKDNEKEEVQQRGDRKRRKTIGSIYADRSLTPQEKLDEINQLNQIYQNHFNKPGFETTKEAGQKQQKSGFQKAVPVMEVEFDPAITSRIQEQDRRRRKLIQSVYNDTKMTPQDRLDKIYKVDEAFKKEQEMLSQEQQLKNLRQSQNPEEGEPEKERQRRKTIQSVFDSAQLTPQQKLAQIQQINEQRKDELEAKQQQSQPPISREAKTGVLQETIPRTSHAGFEVTERGDVIVPESVQPTEQVAAPAGNLDEDPERTLESPSSPSRSETPRSSASSPSPPWPGQSMVEDPSPEAINKLAKSQAADANQANGSVSSRSDSRSFYSDSRSRSGSRSYSRSYSRSRSGSYSGSRSGSRSRSYSGSRSGSRSRSPSGSRSISGSRSRSGSYTDSRSRSGSYTGSRSRSGSGEQPLDGSYDSRGPDGVESLNDLSKSESDGSGSDEGNPTRRRICLAVFCILLVAAIVVPIVLTGGEEGGVTPLATPTTGPPVEPPVGDGVPPTAAPNPSPGVVTPAPTVKVFDPPTDAQCLSISQGEPIAGQENLVPAFFEVSKEVDFVSGSDVDQLISELQKAMQDQIASALASCPDVDGTRRLAQEAALGSESSTVGGVRGRSRNLRNLQATIKEFVVRNVKMNSNQDLQSSCTGSSNTDGEECIVVTTLVTLFLGESQDMEALSDLVSTTFTSGLTLANLGLDIPFRDVRYIGLAESTGTESPTLQPSGIPSVVPSASPAPTGGVAPPTPNPNPSPSNPGDGGKNPVAKREGLVEPALATIGKLNQLDQDALDWILYQDWWLPDAPLDAVADVWVNRYVMRVIFEEMNGNDWKRHEGWMSSNSICEGWYGISCDENTSDVITGLNLDQNELNGKVPTELGLLTLLQQLSLASNDLEGTLPSEIGMLTRLSELDLLKTNLQGSIPVEVSRLQAVQANDGLFEMMEFDG